MEEGSVSALPRGHWRGKGKLKIVLFLFSAGVVHSSHRRSYSSSGMTIDVYLMFVVKASLFPVVAFAVIPY